METTRLIRNPAKVLVGIYDDKAIGMIGAGVDQTERYNLIAMWVEPKSRELGVAESLVNANLTP